MKIILYYLFIILLIFSACTNDENDKIVTAGMYDSDFIYHEFTPPLKVELKRDTITNNYFGEDSIDMNLDDIYDIIVSHRIHLPPETGTPSFEYFPYFRLTVKNDLHLAAKMQSYPMGHGQIAQVEWVDTLNYETPIDNRLDWSESDVFRFMWAVPPVSTAPFGPWYYLTNKEMFIGIRMKIDSRYKYGWIKVKVISREDMQFLSFALEK